MSTKNDWSLMEMILLNLKMFSSRKLTRLMVAWPWISLFWISFVFYWLIDLMGLAGSASDFS